MKKLYSMLLDASLYTVLATLFLCLFSALTDIKSATISVGQFLLVFAFCMIVRAAGEIHAGKSLSPISKRMLHYALVLVAFLVLALLTKKIALKGATIILSVVLFTFVYILFVLIANIVKRKMKSKVKSVSKKQRN